MRRGFSLIEILVVLFVATVSFGVFLTVFRSSYKNAEHTRDKAIAFILARSLIEEVEAHPYGAPEPLNWKNPEDIPTEIYISGKPVQVVFHKKFSYKNETFIGKVDATKKWDVVTIAISWRENTGTSQVVTTGATGDNRELEVKVPVWR